MWNGNRLIWAADPAVFGLLVHVLARPSDSMALRYDWLAIEGTMRQFDEGCEANTWSEVAQQLGRLSRWEFEDCTAQATPITR